MKNTRIEYKLMFTILIGCLIPREESSDQISWDHKNFIWFLVNKELINLPAYIFHHMCEVIKENTKHHKKNVPSIRLFSELFHQSKLIENLMNLGANEDMEIIYGNILSTAILGNMNVIKKKDVIQPFQASGSGMKTPNILIIFQSSPR